MKDLELVLLIGNEVCEGCGPDRDCEMEYDECGRIQNSLKALKEYNKQINAD